MYTEGQDCLEGLGGWTETTILLPWELLVLDWSREAWRDRQRKGHYSCQRERNFGERADLEWRKLGWCLLFPICTGWSLFGPQVLNHY
jgi:hypothetical protein